jgi:hypothetical protein
MNKEALIKQYIKLKQEVSKPEREYHTLKWIDVHRNVIEQLMTTWFWSPMKMKSQEETIRHRNLAKKKGRSHCTKTLRRESDKKWPVVKMKRRILKLNFKKLVGSIELGSHWSLTLPQLVNTLKSKNLLLRLLAHRRKEMFLPSYKRIQTQAKARFQ